MENRYSENQYMSAVNEFNRRFQECLKHGYFEMTIIGEIDKQGKRSLRIKGGVDDKFTFSENEIQSGRQLLRLECPK